MGPNSIAALPEATGSRKRKQRPDDGEECRTAGWYEAVHAPSRQGSFPAPRLLQVRGAWRLLGRLKAAGFRSDRKGFFIPEEGGGGSEVDLHPESDEATREVDGRAIRPALQPRAVEKERDARPDVPAQRRAQA